MPSSEDNFNAGVGRALLALADDKMDLFSNTLDQLRQTSAKNLSIINTASLQGCHDLLLRFHVLTEMEMISGVRSFNKFKKSDLRVSLNLRLEAIGPFFSDKQYILGLRRAVMQLSK